jgi:hypothetical protein
MVGLAKTDRQQTVEICEASVNTLFPLYVVIAIVQTPS